MRKLTNKQKIVKRWILDIGADVVGSVIFAIGLICFIGPAKIAPGGVSAVALMINHLWGGPVGTLGLLMNIPLLVLSFLYLGKRFTINTIRTLIINTLIIDLVITPLLPLYQGDRLLGSVYGGLLMGAGLATIFLRGSTTGGTDIVSYLIQKKFPQLSIGRAMMVIDGVIIALSMVVYGDVETGLFGIIALFVSTKVMDSIIYGMDRGSMVTVVSRKNREIADEIMENLGRGVTFFKGEGAYSREPLDVLMCAVRKGQFARLKSIIHEIDPEAFVVVAEAGQILGEGFNEEGTKKTK